MIFDLDLSYGIGGRVFNVLFDDEPVRNFAIRYGFQKSVEGANGFDDGLVFAAGRIGIFESNLVLF